MKWPWPRAAVEPELIRATDLRIRCRECQSDRPMASILMLRDFAIRDGHVVSEVTGERVACQDCGHVFSIGPRGTFQQHREALPYSPQGPLRRVPDVPREASQQPEDLERAPVLRTPRMRPEV